MMQEFKKDLEKFLNDYSEKLNLDIDKIKTSCENYLVTGFSEDFWKEAKTEQSINEIKRTIAFIQMVKEDMKLFLSN